MTISEEREIYEIVRAFEDRTLKKSEWTHSAHLLVGMHYCIHHAFGVAKNLMSDGINWLNDAHGTPNTDSSGYHETLTMFWLGKIADFLKQNDAETNVVSLANRMLVKLSDPSLPLQFYSRDVLFSREARSSFVKPDRTDKSRAECDRTFSFQPA